MEGKTAMLRELLREELDRLKKESGTNADLEVRSGFHRSIEEEIWNHESLSAYIGYYNEDRLYWSLDIDNYETPLRAFCDRKATYAIRKSNPKWMEENIGDGAT